MECFNYDDQLDRCEHCLAGERCLKGDPRLANDFLCLCFECHDGYRCQFNTQAFSFTLDQLFSPGLLSDRGERTLSLLFFVVLFGLLLALPSNLSSLITVRRRSCLYQGVGHYLLTLSVTNQLSLALLVALLIHLGMAIFHFRSSSSLIDDLFCKLLNYLLTSFTRLSSWLPSFVALERVYSTVFFNKHSFNQPHVARSEIFSFAVILLSGSYELVFYKYLINIDNEKSAMYVIEYPPNRRSMWIFIHQIVSVCIFSFPC